MLSEGQILEGKYRLGRLLGRGGMGAVFLGEHIRIKRQVAIKVLHEEKADSENTQRFEREAEAAGRIGSDHIVEVLDFGTTPDGDRFMVMEYLDGETLKERLKRVRRLDPPDITHVVVQVLEGLAAAHAAGIIHRDLKPDNVFVVKTKAGRADFAKIVDFGISKFNLLTGEAGMMTQTGAVMGTPYYMSPEQARATNEVDARSDLYSVGVVLYEAITGAVPFHAVTLTELMFKIVFEDPPHPHSVVPSLDPDFVSIVLKGMMREPARRFQSAREFQEALVAWSAGRGRARHAPAVAQPVATAPKTTEPMTPDARRSVAAAAREAGFAPPQPPAPPPPPSFQAGPQLPPPRGHKTVPLSAVAEPTAVFPAPPGIAHTTATGSGPGFAPLATALHPIPSPAQSAPAHAAPTHAAPTHGAPAQAARGAPGHAGPGHAMLADAPRRPLTPTLDDRVAAAPTAAWNAPREAPRRSRPGLVVAIGALAITLAGAAWFMATRGGGQSEAATADTAAAAPPAPPAATATATATAAAAAATSAPAQSAELASASAAAPTLAPRIVETAPPPPPAASGRRGAPLRGPAPTPGPRPQDHAGAPARPGPAGASTVKDFGY